jgi:hypothetical protein
MMTMQNEIENAGDVAAMIADAARAAGGFAEKPQGDELSGCGMVTFVINGVTYSARIEQH